MGPEKESDRKCILTLTCSSGKFEAGTAVHDGHADEMKVCSRTAKPEAVPLTNATLTSALLHSTWLTMPTMDLALELAEKAAQHAPDSPADCDMRTCNFTVKHGVREPCREFTIRTNRCFLGFLEAMREMRDQDHCKFYNNQSTAHFIAPVNFRQPPNSTCSLSRVLALVYLEYMGLGHHELCDKLAYDRYLHNGDQQERWVVVPGNRNFLDITMEISWPVPPKMALDFGRREIEEFGGLQCMLDIAKQAQQDADLRMNNAPDPDEHDVAHSLQLQPHAQPDVELPAQPAYDNQHAIRTHLRACLQDVNVPGQPGKRPRAEAGSST